MTPGTGRLKHIIFAILMLFISGAVGITSYTIWFLRSDTIAHGHELASMHSRSFEDVLTQNLHVIELLAANMPQDISNPDRKRKIEESLVNAIRRTPFLRSVSLLDNHGRILASSNRDNMGINIKTDNFLPDTGLKPEILRIGIPWSGRDFAEGKATGPDHFVVRDEAYFIPVIQTLQVNEVTYTLLMAINPDHFINHILQKLEVKEGWVEVLRYDGILLMSSDSRQHPGSRRDQAIPLQNLNESESARFRMDQGSGASSLSALLASRLYPVVVVTHLDLEYALQNWRGTSKTLLSLTIPALALFCLIAALLYRRQAQLNQQHSKLEQIQRINATVFDASTEAILITDIETRIISINQAFTSATGYLPQEVLGLHLFELLTEDSIAACKKMLPELDKNSLSAPVLNLARIEVQQYCKDGRLLWMEILSTPERDTRANITGYHRIGRNITERKKSEEQLQLSANVFNYTREGIIITSANSRIFEVNDAFCNITGYSREEILGQTPAILRSDLQENSFFTNIWNELTVKGYWDGELWSRRKNGEPLALFMTVSAVRDENGKARQHVALVTDITPLKTYQKELEHIAHFDALTGLPNRVLLADRLNLAISQARRRNLKLAIAFLDLDGFKAVNDTYGHDSGDQLLMAVASRMKHVLRAGDTLARMGGDEFVIVLIDLTETTDSIPMLQRLLEAAALPVTIGPNCVQVSASLGVTFFPQDAEINSDQLLRQADQAMYQAKMAGKNRYHIFVPE